MRIAPEGGCARKLIRLVGTGTGLERSPFFGATYDWLAEGQFRHAYTLGTQKYLGRNAFTFSDTKAFSGTVVRCLFLSMPLARRAQNADYCSGG